MTKRVIAVDCDDVLVGTAQLILDAYNATHGTQVTEYDQIWKLMSTEETQGNRDTYLDSPEYLQQQPVQDTVQALTWLKAQYELHIITGRPGFMQDVTLAWLQRHLPDIFETVIFTDFFKDKGGRSKADVCLEIGAQYLVDDHLHHCESVAAVGVQAILFGDYPWNRADELPAGVTRCKDWAAVLEYFDGQ